MKTRRPRLKGPSFSPNGPRWIIILVCQLGTFYIVGYLLCCTRFGSYLNLCYCRTTVCWLDVLSHWCRTIFNLFFSLNVLGLFNLIVLRSPSSPRCPCSHVSFQKTPPPFSILICAAPPHLIWPKVLPWWLGSPTKRWQCSWPRCWPPSPSIYHHSNPGW